MIATRIIRNAATTIDIHNISYEDLNNAMGEARLLLSRLSIEREERLNAQAKESAQVVHDDEKQEREQFEAHVRSTLDKE